MLRIMPKPVTTIVLEQPDNLQDAIDIDDDWTGMTDPASRRKRQTRLNVRAHRRRKRAEARNDVPVSRTQDFQTYEIDLAPQTAFWSEKQQCIVQLFRPKIPTHRFLLPQQPPQLHPLDVKMDIMFPLTADNLIVLRQYNVIRASLVNKNLVDRFVYSHAPRQPQCVSAALFIMPAPDIPNTLPKALEPTTLQQSTPHPYWIDMVPFPSWRDRLILQLGTFDAGALWNDVMGSLFEGTPVAENEDCGIIAWNPPYDPSGWEVTKNFWKKWSWLLGDGDDAVAITNMWRARRGEEPLQLSL